MNTAFFNLEVGISPCLIVSTRLWPVVLSYFREFYPDFEQHDPFLDPDYYAFPFDHVTLDFLGVVYQVDNRMELLQEAEKQEMTFMIFKNWVLNWVLSYNDDIGEEIYQLKTQPDNTWYIKNTKRKKVWRSF
jgi:hypothetical protein